MRSLVFSSLYPNSLAPQFGLFVHRRVEALVRAGLDAEVCAPVPWFPRGLPAGRWQRYAAVPARERIAGIPVRHPRYLHVPAIGMYGQAWSLFASTFARLRQRHRAAPYDLVDAHYVYPDGVAAVRLARALKIPVVVTARGSDLNTLPRFATVRRQIRWALERADALVAVSGALADAMFRLGAPSHKIHVIPNGIDRERFHYADPLETRRRLQVYSDENMLLSVGNLNELKGHALIVEAVAMLRARGIRATLHVFGEGAERPRLEALIAQLGLRGVVTLHGSYPNERLGGWYQAASLFVLASSREGWPNVLNEALACGLPVVATAVGGVPEIVDDGTNGLLVHERSAAALAEAIAQGLQASWSRRAIAAQASKRGWEDVAAQVLGVFEGVCGVGASRRRLREAQVSG